MKYCPQCGAKLEESMRFCPQCGENFTVEEKRLTEQKPEATKTHTDSIERGETTYYSDEHGYIRITESRLVIYSKTYAMANITSHQVEQVPSSRPGKIAMIVLGFFLLFMFAAWHLVPGIVVGVIIMVIGIITTITHKDMWRFRIRTAAGEQTTLRLDWDCAKQAEDAMNKALSKRR